MNKEDMIKCISEKCNADMIEAGMILESIFDSFAEIFSQSKRLSVEGLGSFRILIRPERLGVHPISKKIVVVPSSKEIHFRPDRKFVEFSFNPIVWFENSK